LPNSKYIFYNTTGFSHQEAGAISQGGQVKATSS